MNRIRVVSLLALVSGAWAAANSAESPQNLLTKAGFEQTLEPA